jgi:hypothetical protein
MNQDKYSNAIKEFAGSEVFFKIFDETIGLVQKSSDYLEGVGRFDQARLSGKELNLFSNQSVRLTNCLIQTSSWLLGHRSFFKGEISEPKFMDLSFYNHDSIEPMDKLMAQLPTRLIILISQTTSLFERIVRIDKQLKNLSETTEETNLNNKNVIHNQLEMIRKNFIIV